MAWERLAPEHEPELIALHTDPRVARTLSVTGLPPSPEEVRQRLQWSAEHWERFGFGLYLLRESATGEFVGRGGPQQTFATGADEVEAAWALVPARWGQGLATEVALQTVRLGLEVLGLQSLIAYTTPENLASQRVMAKADFRPEGEFQHRGVRELLYRRCRC